MERSDKMTDDDFMTQLRDSLHPTMSDSVRMHCLEHLADMQEVPRPQVVVGLLLETLKEDLNAVVRHEAAFVLGRLKRFHGELIGDEVFSTLCISARSDPSTIVRHEATEILGKLEDSRVVAVLLELAGDHNLDVALTAKLGLEHQAFSQGATNRNR